MKSFRARWVPIILGAALIAGACAEVGPALEPPVQLDGQASIPAQIELDTAEEATPTSSPETVEEPDTTEQPNVGARMETVPTGLVGSTEDRATATLTAGGIPVLAVIQQQNPTAPRGTIIDAQPLEGTPIPADLGVILVVSNGPDPPIGTAPDTFLLPDVAGLRQAEAQRELANLGIIVQWDTPISSATTDAGHIVRQSPPAGSVMHYGLSVVLTTSLG